MSTATESLELGEYGYLIDGAWHRSNSVEEVRSPYDGELVALAHNGDANAVERAISTAVNAFATTRKIPSWRRAEILHDIAQGIGDRHEEFSRTIALEAGKPIRTARGEVDRAIFTFTVAAEEAKRIRGEIVALDWLPGLEERTAYIHRVPLGPILGITPFNFPLNLVAHKVAPAIAAGNPIIIRPAPKTPVSALKLAEVVLEAGWPGGGISVLLCSIPDTGILVKDERIKLLSFTGSPTVGWMLKSQAGRKRVALELGGNAGTIVHNDADVAFAAQRVAFGGFSYSGQSCISVQRVYAHDGIYESFTDSLVGNVRNLQVGDPLDESTDIGPLINREAAERVERWVDEAVRQGAQVLTGGTRDGTLWQPTVLAAVEEEMKVSRQEVFGPVVGLYRYQEVDRAIAAVDDSEFGLQAGLFTNDQRIIRSAFDQIEVGGLMVNDVSTFRVDHMPYGGVKRSGLGREGLRYAMEEMTEMKLLMVNEA